MFTKVIAVIMFFTIAAGFSNSIAMNDIDNPVICERIVRGYDTIIRNKNDIIFRFDVTVGHLFRKSVQFYGATAKESDIIADLVNQSESIGDSKFNVKHMLVCIPYYTLRPLETYERDFDRSTLKTYNLRAFTYDNGHGYTTAHMNIPKGAGPFPCAILCHGSEGMLLEDPHWELMDSLARQGIASVEFHRFIYDSSLIGNKNGTTDLKTSIDQFQVPLEAEIIYVFRFAQLMESHPRIDKKRIGFIGWSRGATVALECTLPKNIDLFYPNFQPAFCVNFDILPLIQTKNIPVAPLLFLHGANDDYTPVSCLMDYINFLLDEQHTVPNDVNEKMVFEIQSRNEYKPIKIVIFPQSGHAFTGGEISLHTLYNPISAEAFLYHTFDFIQYEWNKFWQESYRFYQPGFMNLSDCCVRSYDEKIFWDKDGQEHPWHEFPSHMKSKMKYGATIEYNPSAALEAWKEALSFIKNCTDIGG
jgi:dienelactone hydrolase